MHAFSPVTGFVQCATLVLVVTAVVVTAPARPASAQIDAAAEEALGTLVDGARGASGAAPVRVCAELRALARSWSSQMAADGRLAHNPDGAAHAGGWRSYGEIVGAGPSLAAVYQAFMDSASHRRQIQNPAYTEVGIGTDRRDGTVWVTAVFREPDGSAPCTVVPVDERITTACPPARVPAAAFADVRGNPHRAAVDCTVWYGLANGTAPGAFSPGDGLTRAQMASFLARLAARSGLTLPAPRDQGFTDLDGGPHADAVNQLAQLSIVEGLSPTVYGPDALVTRAQMATFLVRAYERVTAERLVATRDWFPDDTGRVHEDAINRAAEADFVAGLSPTAYAPRRSVRRDQLASFLARTLDRLVSRRHTLPPA